MNKKMRLNVDTYKVFVLTKSTTTRIEKTKPKTKVALSRKSANCCTTLHRDSFVACKLYGRGKKIAVISHKRICYPKISEMTTVIKHLLTIKRFPLNR